MILAGVNYIEQQVTWCQFYLNENATCWRAPRLWSLVIQADRPVCKESCVLQLVLRSPENTTCVILAKTAIPPKRLQYITDANK